MRAADGYLNEAARPCVRFELGCRSDPLFRCAERKVLRPVEHVGQRTQRVVVPGRRDQRHAKRQSVRLKVGRNGHRAEIEQIDEVGVVAELGVERDRIRQHFADRKLTAGRRDDQRIDRLPDGFGRAPQFLSRWYPLKASTALGFRPASMICLVTGKTLSGS